MKRGDFDAGDTIFKVDESWERDTDKMIERRDVNLLRRDTRGGQIDIHRGNSSKIPFRARVCVQFIVPLNRKSIVIDSIVDPSWINFKIVIKKKGRGREKSVVCFQFPRVSVHLLSPIFFNSTASSPSIPFPSCTFHKRQIYRSYEVQYIFGLESLSRTTNHPLHCTH